MKKYSIIGLIILIIGIGFYNKIYIPKHSFKIITPTKGDMIVSINGIGEVDAKDIYKIGSIYGGKVLEFNIKEGDFVKKGTLIAKVDSIDLGNKKNELKATIKKLQSDTHSLEIEKQSAIVTHKYQENILKRNTRLFKKGAISDLDFQKYKTNEKTSKLKTITIDAKILSLKSQTAQLQASLNGLKERLKRYTIKAPVSGYIMKKYISNFAIINPNQTIVEIVNPKDVWVATNIDTRISGNINIGNSATILLRSSSKEYKGTVSSIKPVNNNITYEREVDIVFNNLPIPFYLQEQAIIKINLKTLKDIVKIPTKVLDIYNQQQGVWIETNGKVSFKHIKILAYDKDLIATKDINSNINLVIPNPKNKTLSNGMKIKVIQ